MMTDNLNNAFWQYSLAHYGRSEVAESCLSYQDNHGANVNLLLFLCWLGCCGQRAEPEQLEQASSLIEEWDLHAVQKIRSIRRFFSSSQQTSSEIAESLQRAELMAEQIVQNILYNWWLEQRPYTSNMPMAALQATNLNTYLVTLGCRPVTDDSPLLRLI
ncbi:MAG: hypothetical protein ACI89Z_000295 [Porticoccus sp.]|jgi:uncharacterized protein (TIGR02444 family)